MQSSHFTKLRPESGHAVDYLETKARKSGFCGVLLGVFVQNVSSGTICRCCIKVSTWLFNGSITTLRFICIKRHSSCGTVFLSTAS